MSNAETALLGLLAERPRHPYQIETEVRNRDMRAWTDLSMSSIYKLLRKLERDGFVVSKTQLSEQNRARKTYEITEDGMDLLRERVRVILSEPQSVKWPIDVAISNLAVIPVEEAAACLRTYRGGLEERLNGYRALEDYLRTEGCPAYRFAFARRPARMLEGEIRWVDEYIEELLAEGGEET